MAEFFGVLCPTRQRANSALIAVAWGDPRHVEKLPEKALDLKFEQGISNAYHGSVDDI